MPKSNESDLKKEIDEISKTIDTVLKNIEAEREKLLPSDINGKTIENNKPPGEHDPKEKVVPLETRKKGLGEVEKENQP